jgi:hypothetical protein
MSATAQPALSSPKLILLVDDTPINLGVISGALKDFYKTKEPPVGKRLSLSRRPTKSPTSSFSTS